MFVPRRVPDRLLPAPRAKPSPHPSTATTPLRMIRRRKPDSSPSRAVDGTADEAIQTDDEDTKRLLRKAASTVRTRKGEFEEVLVTVRVSL
jgi:hypothetical protein